MGEKRSKPSRKRGSSLGGRTSLGQLRPESIGARRPSSFDTERMNRVIAKLLEGKDFANLDEINQYLAEHVMNRDLDELMAEQAEDPREAAQDLAFQALEAKTPAQAQSLARRALALDPGCVDALMITELSQASSPADRIERVRGVMAKFEQTRGEKYFKEHEGHFWGVTETRPYMRVRMQLVSMLTGENRLAEAVQECEGMLRLNPGDNQGVRYVLVGLYLRTGDQAGAERLLKEFGDEDTAVFAWARVLVELLAGRFKQAEDKLKKAIQANRHVFEVLTGQSHLPRERVDYYTPGDMSEAAFCLEMIGMPWVKNEMAMQWLFDQIHHVRC